MTTLLTIPICVYNHSVRMGYLVADMRAQGYPASFEILTVHNSKDNTLAVQKGLAVDFSGENGSGSGFTNQCHFSQLQLTKLRLAVSVAHHLCRQVINSAPLEIHTIRLSSTGLAPTHCWSKDKTKHLPTLSDKHHLGEY